MREKLDTVSGKGKERSVCIASSNTNAKEGIASQDFQKQR